MATRFAHVNIVAKNWRALADFYIQVFGCREKPPERNLSGRWLEELTSLSRPRIRGIHLYLPGYGPDGPTLEIFEYDKNESSPTTSINREGFGHIAFAVDDVEQYLRKLLDHGGSVVGRMVDTRVAGSGDICVVYARDPEGNIVEIQKWGGD